MRIRNLSRKTGVSLLVGTAVLFINSAAFASIVVIGNPNIRINHLTKHQVENIYLGKPVELDTREELQPYDYSSNSPIYQEFYKELLDWAPNQVSSYWSSLIFQGEANPPPTISGERNAIAVVEGTQDAISYIDSQDLSEARGHVKVLYQFGQNQHSDLSQQYTEKNKKSQFSYPPGYSDNKPQFNQVMKFKPKSNDNNDNKDNNKHTNKKLSSEKIKAMQKKAQQEINDINQSLLSPQKGKTSSSKSDSKPKPKAASKKVSNNRSAKNLWPVITSHFELGDYEDEPDVRHEIVYFMSHRIVLKDMLNNAVPYLYYVYQQTQDRNMPAEFALLPMIESDYNPFAYSNAGAVGLWQLMQGTASSFGLEISWWYDGRRDILVSTQAALNYLSSLHDNLHSWLLTAAAYNAGIGTVRSAEAYNKRMDHSTDFWDLPLPNETKWYVPELLALADIIKHPAKYHVKLPYIPNKPYFSAVNVNSQIDLAEIAKLAGVTPKLIHRLNPGMRRWATSPNSAHTLLVPANKSQLFKRNLTKLDGKPHISWQYHQVQRGESLAKIAKNYHTSVAYLEKVNGLDNSDVEVNQGLLVPLHLHRTYSIPTNTSSQSKVLTTSKKTGNSGNLKQLLTKIYSQKKQG